MNWREVRRAQLVHKRGRKYQHKFISSLFIVIAQCKYRNEYADLLKEFIRYLVQEVGNHRDHEIVQSVA